VNFGNRVLDIQRWLGTGDAGSSDPIYLVFAKFVIQVPNMRDPDNDIRQGALPTQNTLP
jgi:hypothetical protein